MSCVENSQWQLKYLLIVLIIYNTLRSKVLSSFTFYSPILLLLTRVVAFPMMETLITLCPSPLPTTLWWQLVRVAFALPHMRFPTCSTFFFSQKNCTFNNNNNNNNNDNNDNNKNFSSNTSLKCFVSQWLLLLSSRKTSEKGIFVSALISISRPKVNVYLLSKNLERKKLPFFVAFCIN